MTPSQAAEQATFAFEKTASESRIQDVHAQVSTRTLIGSLQCGPAKGKPEPAWNFYVHAW